jgi:nucleoside-diphosphate-sugar epimerase
MKRYLVTGGAGFLGSSFVHRLVQNGHRVRVLDNESRGTCRRLNDIAGDFEFVGADIRDATAVKRAVKGVDAVCHFAFINGTEFFYSKPDLVLDVGVKGMVNLLDACMAEGVGELIVASSSEVYQSPLMIPTDETVPLTIPDPHNPRYSYAAGKLITEVMALNYGRMHFSRVVIFRPHNVYGPDMGREHVVPQFILRMRELSRSGEDPVHFPIQGSGKETRAFVYIDDVTDGLMILLERAQHLNIYHIGTTEEITIETVAREVGRYFGKRVMVIPGELRQGGTLRRCPDIAKIAALGYRPKVSFHDGLSAVAQWYDKHAELSGA